MRLGAFSTRAHRLAQVAICVQFLALVRTLAEFFRLQHVEGPTLRVATVAPYVGAGLLAAVLTIWPVLHQYGRRRSFHAPDGHFPACGELEPWLTR